MPRSAATWPVAALVVAGVLVVGALATSPVALAQKNSGPLLPVAPAAPAAPQQVRPVTPRMAPPSTALPGALPGAGGTNQDAERLGRTLPLDPATREIRDGVPPDRIGTERRLGLREPRGPATDMRGRTPSPREIVDALAPR